MKTNRKKGYAKMKLIKNEDELEAEREIREELYDKAHFLEQLLNKKILVDVFHNNVPIRGILLYENPQYILLDSEKRIKMIFKSAIIQLYEIDLSEGQK